MCNVLIVDDDNSFREFVEIALRMEGHTVIVARNGTEAIDTLQLSAFDLIILDLCMPHIDGWDVLDSTRHTGVNSLTPVIVLTAQADADMRHRSLQERVNKLLVKPVNIDEIVDAVEQVLASVG